MNWNYFYLVLRVLYIKSLSLEVKIISICPKKIVNITITGTQGFLYLYCIYSCMKYVARVLVKLCF